MNHQLSKQLDYTMRAFGVSLFTDKLYLVVIHGTDEEKLNQRIELVKWALIIADLRRDPNTNPATIKGAWEHFKRI